MRAQPPERVEARPLGGGQRGGDGPVVLKVTPEMSAGFAPEKDGV